MTPSPTEATVLQYFQSLSNWGRWGDDDELGTANLITAAKRIEGASLVRSGEMVSLARSWDTQGGDGNRQPAQHWTRVIGKDEPEASVDFLAINFHGFATTHIDALCHYFWEGQMWNGKPASLVNSLGARFSDVSVWASGLATRGVLLDIPGYRGADYVSLDAPVRGHELLAAAEAQGVEVRPGDAVCIYSGRERYFGANPDRDPGVHPSPGLHADVAPVIHGWDVGLLVWDLMDARPSGYPTFDLRTASAPVHALALVAMGLPLVDNALLEPVVNRCSALKRWEFFFVVSPLNITGATGSPANPVAIF